MDLQFTRPGSTDPEDRTFSEDEEGSLQQLQRGECVSICKYPATGCTGGRAGDDAPPADEEPVERNPPVEEEAQLEGEEAGDPPSTAEEQDNSCIAVKSGLKSSGEVKVVSNVLTGDEDVGEEKVSASAPSDTRSGLARALARANVLEEPASPVNPPSEEEPEYGVADRSPVYSTVQKPSRLSLLPSPPLSPLCSPASESGVSYATSLMFPASGVSEHPISREYTLDWIPEVPRRQRCVQVTVMEEDVRTARREMLFCDVSGVSEEDRGLTLINSTGQTVFSTFYDTKTGAYGITLDHPQFLSRKPEEEEERTVGECSRVVGFLWRLETTRSRDVWELRDPNSGKTTALIKIRKMQGFVHGCVHVSRGTAGVTKKADIKIKRVRGSADVIVAAVLNDQIITTIRRGAWRDDAVDENIFSLFVAPYIDSVAIVAVFNCVAHLQLRFERPRSTSNIIGMLLANEAREISKTVSTGVTGSMSKTKDALSKSVGDLVAATVSEAEMKLPKLRVGSFPRQSMTPTSLRSPFPPRKQMTSPSDKKHRTTSPRGPTKLFTTRGAISNAEKIRKQAELGLNGLKKVSQKTSLNFSKMIDRGSNLFSNTNTTSTAGNAEVAA